MSVYKSKEIQEMVGLSKIQVSHIVNMNVIYPHNSDYRRGGSHKYNEHNLRQFKIVRKLMDCLMPIKIIFRMMHIYPYNPTLYIDDLEKKVNKLYKAYNDLIE